MIITDSISPGILLSRNKQGNKVETNKETKLRIYNITAKAALKFGSGVWALKKKERNNV
jgi:hypothetical protein